MQYFIDSESKVINFFAPVFIEDLVTELIKLGKDYKGYQVNIVYAKTSTIAPISDEESENRSKRA